MELSKQKIPKAALELAIAGGYKLPWVTRKQIAKLSRDELAAIALDPTFWQALGKSCGWGMELGDRDSNVWKYKALYFYELVLTGGDVEKFWDELLTN